MGLFSSLKEFFAGYSRSDKYFLRQMEQKSVTSEVVDVFNETVDVEQVPEEIKISIWKRLFKGTKKTLDSIDHKLNKFDRVLAGIEKLQLKFLKRREYFHKLTDDYCNTLDSMDLQRFIKLNCVGFTKSEIALFSDIYLDGIVDYCKINDYTTSLYVKKLELLRDSNIKSTNNTENTDEDVENGAQTDENQADGQETEQSSLSDDNEEKDGQESNDGEVDEGVETEDETTTENEENSEEETEEVNEEEDEESDEEENIEEDETDGGEQDTQSYQQINMETIFSR